MQFDDEFKKILKEVSAAISESLSSPGLVQKLEFLKQKGFQLYLIMESTSESGVEKNLGPVMPIQVAGKGRQKQAKEPGAFSLSQDDKDFLRTLKIRVD